MAHIKTCEKYRHRQTGKMAPTPGDRAANPGHLSVPSYKNRGYRKLFSQGCISSLLTVPSLRHVGLKTYKRQTSNPIPFPAMELLRHLPMALPGSITSRENFYGCIAGW